MVGIQGDVNSSGVFISEQDFLPVGAAVRRAKDATLRPGTVSAAHGRDKNEIGITRIDGNPADVPGGGQADVLPGASAIGGFVDAIAISEIRAEVGFTSANINNVGIGWSDCQCADGRDRLAVKDWLPGNAAIA